MVDKGCDNCYYTYFDEKAYPCSLCIRGIERTDKWQPSKKTKADIPQTETHDLRTNTHECVSDTPQTEMDKCYKCKWWNYSYGCSNKKGICDFERSE